jgi:hypothetical protein
MNVSDNFTADIDSITNDNDNITVYHSNISNSGPWQSWAMGISGLIVCPFGILSSILALCALWKKFITERNAFFVLMSAISLLDLLFNILYPVTKWGTPDVAILTVGPLYSISLASDLCTLCLTAERYLALCHPIMMQNLSVKRKKILRTGAITRIILITCIRLLYIISELLFITNIYSEEFKSGYTKVATVLAIIDEIIFPFILMIGMVLLSCRIVVTVVKRQQSLLKVKPIKRDISNTLLVQSMVSNGASM